MLIVLAAMPTVPLDDELLAALSIGVPIGLGDLLRLGAPRLVDRRHRLRGFAAAVGGALVGAWLGLHVVDGLFALVTTIVGASIGGNLRACSRLDIAWDRRRATASPFGPSPGGRPPT